MAIFSLILFSCFRMVCVCERERECQRKEERQKVADSEKTDRQRERRMNPCFISGKEITFKVVAKIWLINQVRFKRYRETGSYSDTVYMHMIQGREERWVSLSIASGQTEQTTGHSCSVFSGVQKDYYACPWNRWGASVNILFFWW